MNVVGEHQLPVVLSEMGDTLCGECGLPISSDRYIMKVNDVSYHERCVNCSVCNNNLLHSCFYRDGKLYCRIDYERIFAKNKCLSCGEKIFSNEFVYRTSDYIFHLRCFCCVVCGCQLEKGDQFVVKACQLFCRTDYEKEVEMLQSFNYDEYLCDELCTKNNRRGPKRPRTILTTQQRRAFKACFDISPRPCRKTRETLANDTGLSLRIVQVWFQNQRAKMKKIEKKGKQKSSDTSGDSNAANEINSGSNKVKDENDKPLNYIKDEIQSDNESLVSAGSSNSINDDPHHHLHHSHSKLMKHEFNEEKLQQLKDNNHPYAALQQQQTYDGLRNKQPLTEPGGGFECGPFGQNFAHHPYNNNNYINPAGQGTTPSGVMMAGLNAANNQIAPTGAGPSGAGMILNPIDRLYSMQNMYFCGEKLSDDQI